MKYSPNPNVNATIEALLAIGCPPIPVAPVQDPYQPGCHQVDFSQSYRLTFYTDENGVEISARSYCLDDRLQKVNGQNDPSTGNPIKNWDDRGVYCPLTSDLKPIPKFTGKNPSYLNKYGRPYICKHGKFQNRIPTKQELKEFFCHPDTGVGTLGGHAGIDWLDFDAKNYESQEVCDNSVQEFIEKNNLSNSWIEKTGSGGYRIAVKPKQQPTFVNFALTPNGTHIGEALWKGRFTVLAPSIHPNGEPYQRLVSGKPVEVESLESISIYPSKDEVEQKQRKNEIEKKKAANPDYGKPTDTADNPYDIRNFAHYFEGYYEKDGWGYAKCPHHNGTSMRSFRLHLDTGAYRVLCSCNTKDVYKSGLALAKSFGFTVLKTQEKPRKIGGQSTKNNPVHFSRIETHSNVSLKIQRNSQEKLFSIFPELETDEGKDWLKMRKFTPDIEINARYFDYDIQNLNLPNLAVKSGLSTGKTQFAHCKFLDNQEIGASAWGYRNALLTQFCEKGDKLSRELHKDAANPWYHLQYDLETKEDKRLVGDSQSRIAACVDSILYYQPHHFENKRIILDEIEGTFKHLYQSNTAVSYKRSICKTRLGEAIANSEATLLLDGNLSDITVAHAEKISGKKFLKIKNNYKAHYGRVYLYEGSEKPIVDEKTEEIKGYKKNLSDYSLLDKMMQDDPENLICASDSKDKLEAWDSLLSEKGHKVFRLDSSNSNSKEAKEFLKNPAKYIIENGVTALLYSPSAESGLDVDLQGYFKRAYFFFFGVVLTNEQYQFLGRVRDSQIECYVFSTIHGQNKTTPQVSEELQKNFIQLFLDCSKISLTDVGDEEKSQKLQQLAELLAEKSNNSHYVYECQILAKQAFEKANLRKCLEYVLRESGYKVTVVTGYKVDKKELEKRQHDNQLEHSQKIVNAPTLTADDAKKIATDINAKPEQKIAVVKQRLLAKLPGIENKTQNKVTQFEVPPEVVKDIEAGYVPVEIAQKMGIAIPKTQIQQVLEPVHLIPDISYKPEEGGQLNIWQIPKVDSSLSIDEKSECSSPETITSKGIEVVHLPPNILIKKAEGRQGQVRFEVTQPDAPVFDADFVHRVKYQDRTLISQIELHYLLCNPEITKLLQQRKWQKCLDIFTDPETPDSARTTDLTNYRSRWLRVHTLMEMGIEFFLNPDVTWTNETPEAIKFWERGQDAKVARYIGVTPGKDSVCAYVGRVLATLDLKTKSKKLPKQPGAEKRLNAYQLNYDYLTNPVRVAIYESISERIDGKIQQYANQLDWDVILQNQQLKEAETPKNKQVEPVHLIPDNLYKTEEGGQGLAKEDGDIYDLFHEIDFCTTGVVKLESTAVADDNEALALFNKIEAKGQKCLDKLPEGFWERLATAVTSCLEALEAPAKPPLPFQAYSEGQSIWFTFEHGKEWFPGLVRKVTNQFVAVYNHAASNWLIQKSENIRPSLHPVLI